MRIEYLARAEDDTLVCVATETDLYQSRVFVGRGSPLQEVAVTGMIDRYRDGGTTDIPTTVGTFHVPSPIPSFGRPSPYAPGGVSLGDRRLTLMDVGTTSAELTDGGLVLR